VKEGLENGSDSVRRLPGWNCVARCLSLFSDSPPSSYPKTITLAFIDTFAHGYAFQST
jgi:hypothetical protein